MQLLLLPVGNYNGTVVILFLSCKAPKKQTKKMTSAKFRKTFNRKSKTRGQTL